MSFLTHRTQRLSPPSPRRTRRGLVRRPAETTTARAQRSGGPQDHALYACRCGMAFEADVSASVGCPRCGSEQAW